MNVRISGWGHDKAPDPLNLCFVFPGAHQDKPSSSQVRGVSQGRSTGTSWEWWLVELLELLSYLSSSFPWWLEDKKLQGGQISAWCFSIVHKISVFSEKRWIQIVENQSSYGWKALPTAWQQSVFFWGMRQYKVCHVELLPDENSYTDFLVCFLEVLFLHPMAVSSAESLCIYSQPQFKLRLNNW